MVLLTLTSQGFSIYRINWAHLEKKSLPLTRSIPLLRSIHWLTVRLRILFKINLLTYTTLCENSLFISTPWLSHRLLLVHWDQTMIIVCQSLVSRPILVPELFTLVPHLFGTTCRCLPIQPFQLLPLRNIWRHISLIWPFPHRYRHSLRAVDITKLFPRFCRWTLIRLSLRWAWLYWEYWRYRSLIDCLIDWLTHCSDSLLYSPIDVSLWQGIRAVDHLQISPIPGCDCEQYCPKVCYIQRTAIGPSTEPWGLRTWWHIWLWEHRFLCKFAAVGLSSRTWTTSKLFRINQGQSRDEWWGCDGWWCQR